MIKDKKSANSQRLVEKSYLFQGNTGAEKTGDIEILRFIPDIFHIQIANEKIPLKSKLVRIYFYILSKKKVRIYYVQCGNNIIHTSVVMPKCWKFNFLEENDLIIGPCYTAKKFRGKGIFTSVLTYINQIKKTGNVYVAVNENNQASLRAIKAAGYSEIGLIKASPFLKKYFMISKEDCDK